MRSALGPLLFLALGSCDGDAPAKEDKEDKGPSEAKGDAPMGAFASYQAKSKSVEAKINLTRIVSGIRMGFEEERVEPGTMNVATGQLPPSTPMTPLVGTCCKQPKGICALNQDDWSHEGWKAVSFEPGGPHYYSYEMLVEQQTVTVRAVGDLDCDGTLSNYEIVGTVVDGTLQFPPDPIATDPLE